MQCSRRLLRKDCRVLRNKRADAAHIRLKFLNKIQVFRQSLRGLMRRTHHKTATHLKADVLQILKTTHPVLPAQLLRMKVLIVFFVRRLMAKKIAVGSREKILFVRCSRLLSYGKGYGTIRKCFLDGLHNLNNLLIRKIGIFPTLQNKSAKSEAIAFLTAGKNLFLAKPIALHFLIAPLYSAVVAIVLAIVCKFDEPSCINSPPVVLLRAFSCKLMRKFFVCLRPLFENLLIRRKA